MLESRTLYGLVAGSYAFESPDIMGSVYETEE
jgi:hypothetical protein